MTRHRDPITPMSTRPTIALRGRTYDRTPRIIVLTRETDTDWWGYPIANPKCPVLQWPKFAWEVAR